MESTEEKHFDFIPTKRGGIKLLYGGRQYHNTKKFNNRNKYWQCYNFKGCKGNITLNNENCFIKENPHNASCVPNSSKINVMIKYNDLKTKVCSNTKPIQKQFEDMICQLQDDGVHLVTDLPKFNNMKSGLYNARNTNLSVTKLHFKLPTEVIIPQKFESFLLADYNDMDEGRILVFSNADIKNISDDYEHFLCDGTFKSCPPPFSQIYTIHGYNAKTKKVVPLFFAFLHNKNEKTYGILFRLIKSRLPMWYPKKITMDYEKSAMNAIHNIFPKSVIKGCFYHFCKSLFKKARALGIKSRVQRRHVAKCAGLARLPLKFIMSGYKYIMRRAPNCEQVRTFNSYFNSYWLSDITFIKKWCCYQEIIRTTNDLEGWHARINKYLGRKNPSLAEVLQILVKETKIHLYRKKIKSKNYETNDLEINSAIEDMKANEITVGHCLEIIAPYNF